MSQHRELGPGLRWPVRVSDLAPIKERFGDRVPVLWAGWSKRRLDQPLTAAWTPSDIFRQLPHRALRTGAVLWIRPISVADAEWLHRELTHSALSTVADWLQRAIDEGEGWQSMRHECTWTIRAGRLDTVNADGMQIYDRELGTGKDKER